MKKGIHGNKLGDGYGKTELTERIAQAVADRKAEQEAQRIAEAQARAKAEANAKEERSRKAKRLEKEKKLKFCHARESLLMSVIEFSFNITMLN